MRKFLISAVLVSTVAAAAPAAAQNHRGYGHQGQNIERQLDQIERQIDQLRDRRLITVKEARRLVHHAEMIDRLHDRYRRNGVSQREHRDLQNRIQDLRQNVRAERQEGRWERRGS